MTKGSRKADKEAGEGVGHARAAQVPRTLKARPFGDKTCSTTKSQKLIELAEELARTENGRVPIAGTPPSLRLNRAAIKENPAIGQVQRFAQGTKQP